MLKTTNKFVCLLYIVLHNITLKWKVDLKMGTNYLKMFIPFNYRIL